MKTIRFTREGLNKIKQEFTELTLKRAPAVKELSRAREMGDLSENGLYHAAKANLRSIDSRIRRLTLQIKLAEIVESPRIIVEENGKQTEYQIVGDFEADPTKNKVSANSPIGSSLINKKPGDIVEIFTPKGKRTLKILKITR